jgi:hypothetical protein
MSTLQDKYSSVVSAAQSAGISNLQVQEQDGILMFPEMLLIQLLKMLFGML